MKKSYTSAGIWNPADVHVKKENSPPTPEDDATGEGSTTSSGTRVAEDEHISPPASASIAGEVPTEADSNGEKKDEEISGDEEENVDVENLKEEDEVEESGESESDPDEDER